MGRSPGWTAFTGGLIWGRRPCLSARRRPETPCART